MNGARARRTSQVFLALSGLLLIGGCSQIETVEAGQPIATIQSNEPVGGSGQKTGGSTPALQTVSDQPDLTMADVLAALEALDQPTAATVQLIERVAVDGQILSREQSATSDPTTGITYIQVDYSEVSQAALDAIATDLAESESSLGSAWATTTASGLVPRSYVTENGKDWWIRWELELQNTLAKIRTLALDQGSTGLDPTIEMLESSTAPLDKWLSVELDVGNPLQFPGLGEVLTPAVVSDTVANGWFGPRVKIGDLQLNRQYTEGDAVVVEISDNLSTTLLIEFDADMRVQAIEQDLGEQREDSELARLAVVVWRRFEITWDVDRSLLQLPAEEDRFNAIDILAAMGMGPECVPEEVTTVAELEAMSFTEVLTPACLAQSPVLQMKQAAAEKFAAVAEE